MPDIKPVVEQQDVIALLQQYFAGPVTQLLPLEGGEIARTFAFTAEQQEYVIRFNQHMGANFEKEAWLYPRLAAAGIPIAPLVQIGRFHDLHFAIAHKIAGKRMNTLLRDEFRAIIPQLITILNTIHHIDISDTQGYGCIGDDGVGLLTSWQERFVNLKEEEPEWEFYGKWHVMFEQTFLERDFFFDTYERMTQLLNYVPEERYLVHSNYGFSNLLVHEGRITAVLDWIDGSYGDFVFDIAWLSFWLPEARFPELFRQHYATQSVSIPAYDERLLCYQYAIGLDALRFYAKANRPDAYQSSKRRILNLQR